MKEDLAMEVEIAGEISKSSEVEPEAGRGVMALGTTGSITCSLHPLVIMNVSEHWTRERAQDNSVQRGMCVFVTVTVSGTRCYCKVYSYRCSYWEAKRKKYRNNELFRISV